MTTTQDFSPLRALAEAVKSWEYKTVNQESDDDTCKVGHTNEDGVFYDLIELDCENYDMPSKPLAAYIAATNPEVCIAMLDALEVLQAENAKHKTSIALLETIRDLGTASIAEITAERDALQAENAAVRAANIDCVNHFDALRIDYESALARLAELERALVYTAHMGHAMPQHMLPPGVCLFDSDGVQVKLPDGGMVFAGRTPQYLRDRYAEAAGASPQPSQELCEYCSKTLPSGCNTEFQGESGCEGYPVAQPSQARELADEEIKAIIFEHRLGTWLGFARAIIAAINAKGGV